MFKNVLDIRRIQNEDFKTVKKGIGSWKVGEKPP